MSPREFELIKLFVRARVTVAILFSAMLVVLLTFLIFSLQGDSQPSETLSVLLGAGIAGLIGGIGVLANALGRDILEHLERMREKQKGEDT